MTRFQPPASLQALITRCRTVMDAAGVDAYVVGGTVRDVLLGRTARDLDLAVSRDPLAIAQRLS